jgi:hypothetical protein
MMQSGRYRSVADVVKRLRSAAHIPTQIDRIMDRMLATRLFCIAIAAVMASSVNAFGQTGTRVTPRPGSSLRAKLWLLQEKLNSINPHYDSPDIDQIADQRLKRAAGPRDVESLAAVNAASADRTPHDYSVSSTRQAAYLQQSSGERMPPVQVDERGWIVDQPAQYALAPGGREPNNDGSFEQEFAGSSSHYLAGEDRDSNPMVNRLQAAVHHPPQPGSYLPNSTQIDDAAQPRFRHFSNRIPASERAIQLEDELVRLRQELKAAVVHNQNLTASLEQNEKLLADVQLAIAQAMQQLTAAQQTNQQLRDRIADLELQKRELEQASSRLFDEIRAQINDLLSSELVDGG